MPNYVATFYNEQLQLSFSLFDEGFRKSGKNVSSFVNQLSLVPFVLPLFFQTKEDDHFSFSPPLRRFLL